VPDYPYTCPILLCCCGLRRIEGRTSDLGLAKASGDRYVRPYSERCTGACSGCGFRCGLFLHRTDPDVAPQVWERCKQHISGKKKSCCTYQLNYYRSWFIHKDLLCDDSCLDVFLAPGVACKQSARLSSCSFITKRLQSTTLNEPTSAF
jgi:hypothetical protein